MKKSAFETKLMMEIAHYRLALLREASNQNLFYSSAMYDAIDIQKIYLLELRDDYFLIRHDLIFDSFVEKFFYVSKDSYEYTEDCLKEALLVLRQTEAKVYEILSKLKIRGFHGKRDFIRRILELVPQLEWVGNIVKDTKSGRTYITVKDDLLCLTYRDGKTDSYMNISKKDFNEKILLQCVEIIEASIEHNAQAKRT